MNPFKQTMLLLAIGASALNLSGCSCCFESKKQLMEDFYPGSEEQIQWMQQRGAEGSFEYEPYEPYKPMGK